MVLEIGDRDLKDCLRHHRSSSGDYAGGGYVGGGIDGGGIDGGGIDDGGDGGGDSSDGVGVGDDINDSSGSGGINGSCIRYIHRRGRVPGRRSASYL